MGKATVVDTETVTSTGTGSSDYEYNIRSLSSEDQPNEPLPYDDVTLDNPFGTIADDANNSQTFTDADWGANKDFYLTGLIIWFKNTTTQFLTEFDDEIFVLVDDGVSEKFFAQTFSGLDTNVGYTDTHKWSFVETILFSQLRKVIATQSVVIYVYNSSGQSIDVEIYLSGIPKTPE